MTKVKIKSDGTANKTTIEVDGVDVSMNVAEVRWHLKAGGLAEVTLKLTDVALDVNGQMAMRFEGPGQPGVHEVLTGSVSADTQAFPLTIDDLSCDCPCHNINNAAIRSDGCCKRCGCRC